LENVAMSKTCKKCGVEKPLTEFYAAKTCADQLSNECKACCVARTNASRKKRWSIHLEQTKAWRQRNPEKFKASQLRYYDSKRRGNAEYQRLVYRRNTKWVEENRCAVNAYNREYRKQHPEHSVVYKARRRGRLIGRGEFSTKEWRELCAQYENRCLSCQKEARLTPDHVIPLARGGSNTIDNIQPLCLLCNKKKYLKTTDYRKVA
jgi:hypothetical protein